MSAEARPTLFTIGFTQTTAERFFSRLRKADVRVVLDTRLNRGGQLSGFAKDVDLKYFLSRLTGAIYRPTPDLAPTKALLAAYRDRSLTWESYAEGYQQLLVERGVEQVYGLATLDRACLLCSEATASHCHRGLAAAYFQATHGESLVVRHL